MSFCSLDLGEDEGSGLSQPFGDGPQNTAPQNTSSQNTSSQNTAPLTEAVTAPLPEGEGVSVTYEGGKH